MFLSVKLFFLLASCAFGFPLAKDPVPEEELPDIDLKTNFIIVGAIVGGFGLVFTITYYLAEYCNNNYRNNNLPVQEMAMAPEPVVMNEDDVIINIDEEEDDIKKDEEDINAFEVNGIDLQLEPGGSDEDYYHANLHTVDDDDAEKVVDENKAVHVDHQLGETIDPINADLDVSNDAVCKAEPNLSDDDFYVSDDDLFKRYRLFD